MQQKLNSYTNTVITDVLPYGINEIIPDFSYDSRDLTLALDKDSSSVLLTVNGSYKKINL